MLEYFYILQAIGTDIQGEDPNLQQQRAETVLVDDPLTCGGHVCLLNVIVAARAFPC